ncbi:MAG: hypothetical protein ABSF80_12105 [Chitinispirillaceae bacterium]|jgi:hypothetical protein
MKSLEIVSAVCMTIVAYAGINYGDDATTKLTASGFVTAREGDIFKGESDMLHLNALTEGVWVQEMFTGFNVQSQFNPYPITGNLGMEMRIGNEYPFYPSDQGKSRRLYFYPYLSRADLTYSFGDKQNPYLNIALGYFPFKYNDDARNLGEYLFRSGTYPQYLITNFDFPLARLLGLHLSGSLIDKIKWDVLATTNIEWTAIGDLNLSAIVSYKPIPAIEVGGGVSFCSIISVNKNMTTPDYATTSTTDRYVENGDTLFYTFAGTKLMARGTLDPQSFFPNTIFGKEDLKVYGELAVLGVKNYPASLDSVVRYDDILTRMPIMFGFNFPAFKVLDVLSLQGEWFYSRYPDDMNPLVFDNQPIPFTSFNGGDIPLKGLYNPNAYKGNIWKWSVYGKKTLAGHFQITFQCARDHLRWYRMDFSTQDYNEALRTNKDWYGTVKVGYVF